IVNSGSGCLFQPASDDYSYVLTAKHVLEDNNKITRQTLNDAHDVIPEKLEIIGSPFIHEDTNKDAAIFKVKRVSDIESLLRDDSLEYNSEKYFLSGHPLSRIDNDYSFRDNKLELTQPKEYGYIEATLGVPALHHEVIGQSGGGIIKIEDSCFLLAGIQKKMTTTDDTESLGRIEFAPLSFFDEIINSNPIELSPLYPPYIVSFSNLTKEIFELDNFLAKKDLIHNQLLNIASNLCADFSPEKILELFGDSLLVHNCNPSLINHKALWVSFLELTTINQLHTDNKLTYDELKDLSKKRRLILVDTDKWTKRLEDIYRSDLSDVEKGGSVIVCATREKSTSLVEVSSDVLEFNIAVPRDDMNISNTIQDPFRDLRLINIYKFQDHIIRNADAFLNASGTNIKEILKNETRNIL
ncbi:trypsin-like peptidase domain-containing protein, partial [Carboxylicivirga sp. A043]|uniref:ABC-three component system protein n=1 Tax=Carboxylicivirga litoralis TaxID=2816963 RepID=UPI0021CAF942